MPADWRSHPGSSERDGNSRTSSLNGGRYLGDLPRLVTTLHEALQVLQKDIRWPNDAEQFLIDLVALCWFPLAQVDTFLKPLGVDVHDPDLLARRKRHVVHLLLGRGRASSRIYPLCKRNSLFLPYIRS